MAAVQNTQEDHPKVLSVMQARGARRGRHMIWVLGISMLLIVAGFVALYLAQLPQMGGSGAVTDRQALQQANGVDAPLPPSRQAQNRKPAPSITPGIGSDGKGL